jgi:hypothetical protein
MPRGRSTFTKRQKEHTRQQRQRDKAERRSQRKQEIAYNLAVELYDEFGGELSPSTVRSLAA